MDQRMQGTTYVNEPFRYDYVLSNWIFVWFLLYFARVIPVSPLLAMLIGLACNTYEFVSKQQEQSFFWRTHYIFWNLNLKILPLVLLLAKGDRIHWKHDLFVLGIVYGLFLCWGVLQGKNASRGMNPFNFNVTEQPLA